MKNGCTSRRNFRLILSTAALVWLLLCWKSLSSLQSVAENDGDGKALMTFLPSQQRTSGDYSTMTTSDTTMTTSDKISAPPHDVVVVWKPQPAEHTQWCRASDPIHPGLIYVKVPKTASSTLAGINMRIARKVGQRTLSSSSFSSSFLGDAWFGTNPKSLVCTHTKHHGRKHLLERRKPALVWTFLRDPAKRAISDFYHFRVSRRGVLPTNARLAIFLEGQRNYQWDYLVDHDDSKWTRSVGDNANHHKKISTSLQKYFLEAYDFIGLVERKEESLAVMKLLWNLDYEDLIVLSAKKSGQYDDGRSNATCTKIIQKNYLSNHTKSVLANGFRRRNYDYELYEIVNRTLDDTIRVLGYDRVQKHAERLRFLQHVAEEQCQSKAVFPCSSNGTRQHDLSKKDCYLYDSGCGYRCVDRVLEEIMKE
jgi:hypothetical protein